jgi:predicted naringenin-chalcone synthase
MAKITSLGTAVPEHLHLQQQILQFARRVHSSDEKSSRVLEYLYRQSGINSRYSVLPDYSTSPAQWEFYPDSPTLEPFPTLEKRMDWYHHHAAPLSIAAILQCLGTHTAAQEITHLITVSCTGMRAPGLDLEIAEMLQLSPHIFRTSVNFMGCYAAIHALKIADAFCTADSNAKVLIVCTELCTLHFQKAATEDNITATLLFADGSAAALVEAANTSKKGIVLKQFFSQVASNGKKDMSWQLSSAGFLMQLSGYVPALLKHDFLPLVTAALQKAGLSQKEITHWCIHPGGKKILEAVAQSLSLPQAALQQSYAVLQEYGNMSSATILFVLAAMWPSLSKQQDTDLPATIFGAAFGPGLTLETFIASYD